MTAIYLIGPPGVGKTSTARHLMAPYRVGAPVRVAQGERASLWCEPLTTSGGLHVGWHLGRTRPDFGGTDALSMAVHPVAVAWARALDRLPPLVVGEGQRLATVEFLTALADTGPTVVAWMVATEVALAARREERGSRQDPSWCKAGATRAARLAERLRSDGRATVLRVDTTLLTPSDAAAAIRVAARAVT